MIEVIVSAAISSFLATISFGILFNIHGKKLIGAGICGMLGGIAYKSCLYIGMSEINANLVGGIALAFYAECMARYLKSPVTTFIACALIPLVPGGGLYRMMRFIIQGMSYAALDTLLITLEIASTLAIGILIVSTVFKHIHFKRK